MSLTKIPSCLKPHRFSKSFSRNLSQSKPFPAHLNVGSSSQSVHVPHVTRQMSEIMIPSSLMLHLAFLSVLRYVTQFFFSTPFRRKVVSSKHSSNTSTGVGVGTEDRVGTGVAFASHVPQVARQMSKIKTPSCLKPHRASKSFLRNVSQSKPFPAHSNVGSSSQPVHVPHVARQMSEIGMLSSVKSHLEISVPIHAAQFFLSIPFLRKSASS